MRMTVFSGLISKTFVQEVRYHLSMYPSLHQVTGKLEMMTRVLIHSLDFRFIAAESIEPMLNQLIMRVSNKHLILNIEVQIICPRNQLVF